MLWQCPFGSLCEDGWIERSRGSRIKSPVEKRERDIYIHISINGKS